MYRRLCPTFRRLQSRTNTERWSHSAAVKHALQYKQGDKIGGYTVRQVEEVTELHLAAVRLVHENTGADFLHIARDDRNNLFSVAFSTHPKDDTGVAHILEHLSLSGSQRYPCRDPFMKMNNRSLATFMNAMTGCDVTFYPFSTQNQKDYENLLRVYLDAVFFPQLLKLDFKQEGWRFEHADVNDKSSPITIKGVVYNEMKGVFSNSSSNFNQAVVNKLCSSGVYSHVSGGHPLAIPDLTWEQLREFHSTHYHPSNARFLTYGDFPIEPTLSLIDELALSKFSKSAEVHSIPLQPRWDEPRKATITCAPDPLAANPDKQSTVAVTYAMNDITDMEETFMLSILSHLLVNGPNAPFYKSLLQAGIGADYAPSLGYDNNLKQAFFSVGLYGVSEKDVDKVTDIIDKTFDEVIRDGFPQERIEAALHSVELSLKHQTSNFGMSLNYATVGIWNHGGDPVKPLQVNRHVKWLRDQLEANPRFFQEKVEHYFKANRHKLTLVMNPDSQHESRIQSEEENNINKRIDQLDGSQRESVYNEGLELLKHQMKAEDEQCLPRLLLSDVSPTIEFTKLNHLKMSGVKVQTTEQATNGVTYFRAVLNASQLTPALKRMIPLFCEVATKMGTVDKDYRKFSQEVELRTGGLGVSVHVANHPNEAGHFEQGILLSSHCLEANTEAMFALWKELFLGLTLEDEERLSQLIQMCAASLAQSLSDAGHHYAMLQSGSYLSASSQLQEEFSGVSHIVQMKTLAEAPSHKFLLPQLKELACGLLNKESIRCSLNASPTGLSSAENQLDKLLESVPGSCTVPCPEFVDESDFYAKDRKIHFVFPFSVNYCARSFNAVPYAHPDYSSLSIASQLLSHKYLLREVREKGGAYGAGAVVRPGGCFSFYSYRDPNLERTLGTFSDSVSWLERGEFTEKDLEEAKLSCFAKVDSPIAPGSRGLGTFLNGITDQMKEQHRQQLFSNTKDQVIDAIRRSVSESCTSSVAVIGPENGFTETGKQWLVHRDGTSTSQEEPAEESPASQTTAITRVFKKGDRRFSEEPPKIQDGRFVLRIRGLPWKVVSSDVVQLFTGAGFKVSGGTEGVLLQKKGYRPTGVAFVELESQEDYDKALQHPWKQHTIFGRYIEAFPSNTADVRHYVMSKKPEPASSSTKVLYLRGLPWEASEDNIRTFFSRCKVSNVTLPLLESGSNLGFAYVEFASADDARRALSMRNRNMGSREVEVYSVAEDSVDRLVKGDVLRLASYSSVPTDRSDTPAISGKALRPKNSVVDKGTGSARRLVGAVNEYDAESLLHSKGHRVLASGMPFSKNAVSNFLWPVQPTEVVKIVGKDGKPNGKVIVEFRSHDDALKATEKDGETLLTRTVKMRLFSSDSVDKEAGIAEQV